MSGFRRQVDENCVLLGYYAASSGDFVPTFRDNLSILSSRIVSLDVTLSSLPIETYYEWFNDSAAIYEVRQFNSRNGPVKAKFAYLCTSGCCRLRNTLLVKLCTSWDDGATAGNRLDNSFPEYLAVTFSRCVGCQKVQKIFVPSGHFFNFGKSQKLQGAKSGEYGGWSIFVMEFLACR